MNRKAYPSDISRTQFAPLLPLLESARKRTAPRKVDLYDVSCHPLSSAQRLCLACLTGRFSQMAHRSLELLRKYPEDLQSLDEIRKPHSTKQ